MDRSNGMDKGTQDAVIDALKAALAAMTDRRCALVDDAARHTANALDVLKDWTSSQS